MSQKRWFAKVNMMSFLWRHKHPVPMATIRHCSTLEFGRGGAYNQAVAPGITRPFTPVI